MSFALQCTWRGHPSPVVVTEFRPDGQSVRGLASADQGLAVVVFPLRDAEGFYVVTEREARSELNCSDLVGVILFESMIVAQGMANRLNQDSGPASEDGAEGWTIRCMAGPSNIPAYVTTTDPHGGVLRVVCVLDGVHRALVYRRDDVGRFSVVTSAHAAGVTRLPGGPGTFHLFDTIDEARVVADALNQGMTLALADRALVAFRGGREHGQWVVQCRHATNGGGHRLYLLRGLESSRAEDMSPVEYASLVGAPWCPHGGPGPDAMLAPLWDPSVRNEHQHFSAVGASLGRDLPVGVLVFNTELDSAAVADALTSGMTVVHVTRMLDAMTFLGILGVSPTPDPDGPTHGFPGLLDLAGWRFLQVPTGRRLVLL